MKLFLLLLVVTITIFAPLGFIYRRMSRKEKDYLNTLYNHLGEYIKLSEHQLWNNILIGVNKMEGKLFFLRKQKERELFKMIDLSRINRCQLLTSNKNMIINQIMLSFISFDQIDSPTVLEIYNSKTDKIILPGELQFAIRWENIANLIIEEFNVKKIENGIFPE
jgi:hypothetical protein